MTTPTEYRTLAAQYRDAGQDANADVCEIMAQEAERLARFTPADDDTEIHDDDTEVPAVIHTSAGLQYVLPLEV